MHENVIAGEIVDAAYRIHRRLGPGLLESIYKAALGIEALASVHKRQLLTYLRATGLRVGLPLNFGAPTIKKGLVRLVNGLPD